MQLLGHDVGMPEKCYGGGYVKDIAQGIIDRDGNKWESVSDQERMEAFREIAYQEMLDLARETLTGFGTTFASAASTRPTRTARRPFPALLRS